MDAWRLGLVQALGLSGLALAPLASEASKSAPTAQEAATAPLLVHFMEQQPVSGVGADGQPTGEMVQRMRRAAQQAGVPLRWQLTPLKRSVQDLRDNRDAFCVLGLFRTAEREAFARFSPELMAGEPQILVVRREAAARVRQHASARAILLDGRLRLLVYDGVSYGEQIDRWVLARQGPTLRAIAGSMRAFEMLSRNRADVAVSTQRAFEEWKREAPEGLDRLEWVESAPLPAPPGRHLACSHKVPEIRLRALDRAIQQLDER
ncbi:substrate-binding periplasmic protein [Inhella sp.]|uniref:substrate-binding periplasmic protein n=1 Tax=Inhella sp. TaxID=1921806 RepID=UPI0035B221FE